MPPQHRVPSAMNWRFSLQCRGDEVGGSVLVEQAAGNGIHVEI